MGEETPDHKIWDGGWGWCSTPSPGGRSFNTLCPYCCFRTPRCRYTPRSFPRLSRPLTVIFNVLWAFGREGELRSGCIPRRPPRFFVLCSDPRGDPCLLFCPGFAGILRRVGCILNSRPVVCIDRRGWCHLEGTIHTPEYGTRENRAVLTEIETSSKGRPSLNSVSVVAALLRSAHVRKDRFEGEKCSM